jgi:hypothetical protein
VSLHVVIPWREELDDAEARYMAATTIEEAEAADAAFFAVDADTRKFWLAAQYPGWGVPDPEPEPDRRLHLV